MAFVNKVNHDLHTVRAAVLDAGVIALDYYIPIEGGITPQAIVLAVRRFQVARDAALRRVGRPRGGGAGARRRPGGGR